MSNQFLKSILCSLLFLSSMVAAQNSRHGIKGQQAPEFIVDEWVHLPKGEAAPELKIFKGKVIYLYCFQSWCPGCHSSGFPTLSKVNQHFKNEEDVEFLAVQTVFEGFSNNTPKKAKDIVKRYKLDSVPVGHSGKNNVTSKMMRDYRTGGTPWTVIIGKDGKVRYNDYHLDPEQAIKLINKLRSAK